MTKLNAEHESHIAGALAGMLAVFGECAFILKPGKRKSELMDEGEVVALRRIESDGKGVLKIWGEQNKDNDWRKVKASDVRIYMGRVPDWRLEMYIDSIGYQAETYAAVQPLQMRCRDFGGSPDLPAVVQRLESLSSGWLAMFKRKL